MWGFTGDVQGCGDVLEMHVDVGDSLEHGTPTVATLSKESDSLSFSNNHLPIAPQ